MALGLRWWSFWLAALGMPAAILVALLLLPSQDSLFGSNSLHFYVVSGTAVAATVASGVIVGLTRSLRETRLLFLGLAFMSIAAIFAVHGLGTPGHIHAEAHAELSVSTWLSVLAGAFFIAASVVALPEGAEAWLKRWGGWLFGAISRRRLAFTSA